MAATKISLKLLLNKSTNKVLFAEAGKDFVDFLFSILALPIGTVITILTQEQMVGSFGRLYNSLDKLSSTHLQSKADKDILLNPPAPSSVRPRTYFLQLPNEPVPDSTSKTYYCCVRSLQDHGGYRHHNARLSCSYHNYRDTWHT